MDKMKYQTLILIAVFLFGFLCFISSVSAECTSRTVAIDANKIDSEFAKSIGLRFQIHVTSDLQDIKLYGPFVDPRTLPWDDSCYGQCNASGSGNEGVSCWVNATDDKLVFIFVTIWARGKTLITDGKLNKQYGNHIEIVTGGPNELVVDCGDSHWHLEIPLEIPIGSPQ